MAWQRRRRRRVIRVEIRRAARKSSIKVRPFVDILGRPHAYTPDGWPAHEPWRGAAIHAHESGAMNAAATDTLDASYEDTTRAESSEAGYSSGVRHNVTPGSTNRRRTARAKEVRSA